MTARLTLICHATTVATHLARFPVDEPLDPGGVAEAVRLAATQAMREPLARATGRVTSPSLRARQTAEILAADFAQETALREWDCGRWRGRALAALGAEEPEAVSAWLSDPAAAPHDGESLLDLLARVEGWLAAMAGQGGRTLAVTHAAILRAVVVSALASGPASFWRIEVPPLCRLDVTHDGRRWTLHRLAPAP